jgi:RimJ/RimL family protein N-acetyltransferase
MVLRELTIDDLHHISERVSEDEKALCKAYTGKDYHDAAAAHTLFYQSPGPKWCMALSDEPEGAKVAVGYTRLMPGVFRSWFVYAEGAFEEHGEAVTRLSAEIIQHMLAQVGAHRLETITLASRKRAQRWYARIGLRYETTLHGFSVTGEDSVMYVATRNAERP